jgi:RNA polymerase sigma-70 factor, ECF subfamily
MRNDFSLLMRESIPELRGYARALCRNIDDGDDLVQDALLRAWSARNQFLGGTNFRAWLFTILRNRFHDQRRHDRIHQAYVDTNFSIKSFEPARQEVAVTVAEVACAFRGISRLHQQVLMLVAVNGFSYEEAASQLGCPVGTIRSRLSRARRELVQTSSRGGSNRQVPRIGHTTGAAELLACTDRV